jgi:TPR repeat protein
LEKVLNEFENVVQKYVAVAKNIQAQRKAKSGEITEAVSMWREASDMGYSRSQFNLGLSYETGRGVTKDARKVCVKDVVLLLQ